MNWVCHLSINWMIILQNHCLWLSLVFGKLFTPPLSFYSCIIVFNDHWTFYFVTSPRRTIVVQQSFFCLFFRPGPEKCRLSSSLVWLNQASSNAAHLFCLLRYNGFISRWFIRLAVFLVCSGVRQVAWLDGLAPLLISDQPQGSAVQSIPGSLVWFGCPGLVNSTSQLFMVLNKTPKWLWKAQCLSLLFSVSSLVRAKLFPWVVFFE